MVDTVITLGSGSNLFTFQDMEIPEFINFGGKQQIVQHDLIGGNRIVDSLGKNDDDISWGGLMTGPTALTRAIQLNQMRVSGDLLPLTLFSLYYSVVIESFKAYIERYYQVRYEINFRVVIDSLNPVLTIAPTGFNAAINADIATITTISNSLQNEAVTAAVANVTSAYNAAVSSSKSTSSSVSQLNAQTLLNAAPQLLVQLGVSIDSALTVIAGQAASYALSLFGTSS